MTLKWSEPIYYGDKGGYVWPDYNGVYVIAKEEDGKMKAVYVGHGKIRDRMQTHEGGDEPNKCLKDFMKGRNSKTKVFHARIDSEEERNDAEYTIWHAYGGDDLLCNDIKPPGKLDLSIKFPFDKIDPNY